MANFVLLTGRLGKDPEIKKVNDKSVAKFSLANDIGYGDNKKTIWVTVVAWEKQADLVSKYLSKGSKVLVQGQLQIRSYEKDGETKYVTEVIGRQIEFLDSKKSEEGGETKKKPQSDDDGWGW